MSTKYTASKKKRKEEEVKTKIKNLLNTVVNYIMIQEQIPTLA